MAPKSRKTANSSSTTDPVAYRSGALCDSLNQDLPKDSIRALAQWADQLDRPPKEAALVKIDATGFKVEYRVITQFLNSNPRQTVRIEFSQLPSFAPEETTQRSKPNKSSFKDVTEAKQAVQILAEHALRQVGFPEGTLSRTQNNKYETSTPVLYAPSYDFLLPFLVVLAAYILYVPFLRENLLSDQFRAYLFDRVGGDKGVEMAQYALRITGQVHAVEACAMPVLAMRRGSSGYTTLLWTVSTFICGFPLFVKYFRLNPLPLRYKAKGPVE